MSLLAPLIFFLLALLAVVGGMALWTRARSREREEEVLLRLRSAGNDGLDLRPELEPHESVRNPLLRWACYLVWRTGADVEPAMVARWMIALALLIPVAMVLMGVLAGLVVVGIVVAVGWALLSRQAARRRAKIIDQVPDYLDSVSRVLSAGNSLEEAVVVGAQESPEPIRGLFSSVGRQVRLGAPLEQVLREMADINKIRDLRVMALAASINRKYGGSMREIFRSLIQAIRSRDMAMRELRALTGETRFSAFVLAIIPVGVMLYILAMNPEYYVDIWADAGGRMLLIGAALMQVAGVFVMWRMMNSIQDGDS